MPDQNVEWVEMTGAHSDETTRVTRDAWDMVWSKKVDPDSGAPVWSVVEDQPPAAAKPATVKAQARPADADKPGGNA